MAPPADLSPWLDSPRSAGVFTDFDGTLSEIVEDYELARPLPGVAEVLARLAERYARVAVISGRPVAYLAEHLAGAGSTGLAGLYGMERSTAASGETRTSPGAERWRAPLAAAAAAAARSAPPGLRVENKGLAVTLHYRQAPGAAGWAREFADRAAADDGLVAQPGKASFELRPPVEADKGAVLAELSEGLDAVCFCGDDTGDLPAFNALRRMAGSGVATLAVAVAGPETPDELIAAADAVVDGPRGALAFLRDLTGD